MDHCCLEELAGSKHEQAVPKDLCSVLVVHFDLMHCRYLGYLQQLFGSVFWLLCEEMMQRSPLVNLHELWNFLKTYQAEHKVHSPYSQRLNKLSMYKKQTDFPKLRGKASEIKDMAAAMEAMWSFFAIPGQDFQEIGLLLRLTCEFEEILQEWPLLPSCRSCKQTESELRKLRMLVCYGRGPLSLGRSSGFQPYRKDSLLLQRGKFCPTNKS